ncbi:aldehyde dehydrogenase [Flagellimonas myxillae]|uniref:aldehyde dehydrogenase n=1 Tax=Flagellimonas myxillae TaxID=2942214 RepID=UPI00201F2601|nr:aldehyde dehydrogenase [Muricauda myxillae]MCL6267058.1 aldehyde dehydrogenase [Muricauda myxillae]
MEVPKKQRDFFASQKTKDVAYRKKALKRLQKEILAREDDVCKALYADFKKPEFETLVAETQFVLAELKVMLKNMEFWARPERVSSILANWPSSDYLYREPYGTVLLIAPWNYPFQLVFAPLVGAVAAGNTVVVKPSELTPNTSQIITEIVAKVFEPGHVSVVEGGVEVSQQLLVQKWDYIFFTGSTKVGQIVYESAAKHLTPVTLELGGKNPCIVDDSASIKLTAKRIVWGKFLNAGQTCIASDYILVHRKVKAALIEALKKSIQDGFGDISQASDDYARIVNEKHHARLKTMLEGQDILFGGISDDTDNYLSPTLVDEPQMDSPLMEGEIFGPILPIIAYETEEDIDNHISHYGKPLATYIFSNRKSFQKKMLDKYSFGGGCINDTVIQISNKKLPFGGVGASGLGGYHGKASFEIFSNQKGIIKKANWFDAPLRYPPYKLPNKIVKMIKHLF